MTCVNGVKENQRNWWKVSWLGAIGITCLLQFCFSIPFTGLHHTMWLLAITTRMWCIWASMNDFIFNKNVTYLKDILFNRKLSMLIWVKASKMDMVKGRLGIGGNLGIVEGTIRALFWGKEKGFDSELVELLAMKKALDIFVEAGWCGYFELIIESSSSNVINWVKNFLSIPKRMWAIFIGVDAINFCPASIIAEVDGRSCANDFHHWMLRSAELNKRSQVDRAKPKELY
ncbi:hypothetical protein GQ457_08G032560 [Hibiscus cannabinus]